MTTKASEKQAAPSAHELARQHNLALTPEQIQDGFKGLLAEIPTAADAPTESMLLAILSSPSPEHWENVFDSASFKNAATRQCRIHAIRTSPSQFPSPSGVFLICEVTWLDTGERSVLTCSSVMAMAQLVNAWKLDALPIDVEIYRKPTPTKAGFFPMRLKYLGRDTTPIGDPAAVVSEQ